MELHCPNCNTIMNITQKHGIEIDYCPECRGVWLDRGELDKILAQVSHLEAQRHSGNSAYNLEAQKRKRGYEDDHSHAPRPVTPRRPDYRLDDDDDDDRGERRHYEKRRKRGFLDDLFDIFD